ncbi:helix-turn-helix transcriptional regulator [Corallococcus exiguus]|uniref:winged helix-turn-helix transcriptional regulator n=1 Tax=Corallococcus TaxID=83461 RepID=UPI000ED9BFE0|nr:MULTISPECIES: helix-turn-helix domain-containing protein [Corallococcus]NNC16658.1 helix-turn-helix transcriptional regulator [Corallococcus exiguus]NRD52499.1 helix-turn-helix transcriptional regulator [Corallococcus exiguus]NRD63753.1 helix-turn-helix transcriptional regulator [Corallococcus exiguus]RKI02389.1 transcriptional regulator [Corallococcus sp. AB030]RUO93183.1 transcriptional regulator [Corallococcus sp. AB018]
MAKRKPGGPFVATCPTRELLDQLADKWSVLLLLALSDGPVRFNALKRKVEGITQKMLGQTLRRLERNGLVERRVFATVPVTVEYEVTPLGRSLYGIVDAIRNWSIDHIGVVKKARERFDSTDRAKRRPVEGEG